MGVLATLLPAEVIVVEGTEAGSGAALFPEEEASLGRAAGRRRRQFQAGRACAHEALRRLGLGPSPLPIGPRRAPRWPPGVRGSITHCEGYCAAAVARHPAILGVGIDAETTGRVSADVAARVCDASEIAWLRDAPQGPGRDWATLLWSAKESIFKALEPAGGSQPGFRALRILPDPDGERFEARLETPREPAERPLPDRLHGRFAFHAGRVLTAVVWRSG